MAHAGGYQERRTGRHLATLYGHYWGPRKNGRRRGDGGGPLRRRRKMPRRARRGGGGALADLVRTGVSRDGVLAYVLITGELTRLSMADGGEDRVPLDQVTALVLRGEAKSAPTQIN